MVKVDEDLVSDNYFVICDYIHINNDQDEKSLKTTNEEKTKIPQIMEDEWRYTSIQ